MKVAALEGATSGLTANAVLPGWMYTPIVEKQIQDHISLKGTSREDVIASMVEEHPAKRFVETAEVASLVTFLASADASGISQGRAFRWTTAGWRSDHSDRGED